MVWGSQHWMGAELVGSVDPSRLLRTGSKKAINVLKLTVLCEAASTTSNKAAAENSITLLFHNQAGEASTSLPSLSLFMVGRVNVSEHFMAGQVLVWKH